MLYLFSSSLTFRFDLISPRFSLSNMITSLLILLISTSIRLFYHGSTFLLLIGFFRPNCLATHILAALIRLFDSVMSFVPTSLIALFTFLVSSSNLFLSTFHSLAWTLKLSFLRFGKVNFVNHSCLVSTHSSLIYGSSERDRIRIFRFSDYELFMMSRHSARCLNE